MKNKKKKKILIIEDEKILGEMYRETFIQAGFEVVLVDTAEKGLQIVGKEKPDLILLDILLPKANGIAFLAKVSKTPKIASIPIIAFSNLDDPETKKKALWFGAKDYLIKTDYTPQQFIKRVKSYL